MKTSPPPTDDRKSCPLPATFKHQSPHLVHWDDLPPFLQDNEFIHTSYRPASTSYLTSIRSLAYTHNQTGNIYTQLIFVLLLLTLAYHLLQITLPSPTSSDRVVFGIFFIGLITSLSLSFVFHTICNHSKSVQDFWLNLDFIGLLVASSCGFVPGVWYTFYCASSNLKLGLIIARLLLSGIRLDGANGRS